MIVTIGNIPVYDALITDAETGMFKISLVDDPAVMSNFQAFDRERKMQMYAIEDEEKRLVRGVVMRADFPIYRVSEGMGEYYVIYKAEEIRKMAEKYLAESRQNDVNIMHREGSDVEGVQMVQYFIKDSAAGIAPSGFDEISDGSLFAEFHIVNDDVWNAIKAGEFKGFSLEGYFDMVPETDVDEVQSIVDTLAGAFRKLFTKNHMSKLSKFKEALAAMLQEFSNVTTDKGILAWDGDADLKEGDAAFIEDAEGNRNPAEDGDYKTEDGKIIVIVDGKVAEIKDAAAEVAPEAPEAPEAEGEGEGEMRKKRICNGAIATDKGAILWDGDEDLKAGDEVFVEKDGENVPAEDGEYITEDGKVIVVAEGKVAEIKDAEAEVAPEAPEVEPGEVEDLKAQIASLSAEKEALAARIAELEKMSAAKPAHEEFEANAQPVRTGLKGIDKLAQKLGR